MALCGVIQVLFMVIYAQYLQNIFIFGYKATKRVTGYSKHWWTLTPTNMDAPKQQKLLFLSTSHWNNFLAFLKERT